MSAARGISLPYILCVKNHLNVFFRAYPHLPYSSSLPGGRSLAFRLVSTDTSVSAPPTDITANLRRRSELEVNSMVEKSFETKVSEQGKHATNVSDEHVKNASAEEEIKTHSTEHGGPKGLEPTRYNDWERAGRVSDF